MAAAAAEPLRLRREGAVGVVEIDNPPANALGWQLYGALEDLVPRLAADEEIRAVVFASANPKIFVAGADLRARGPAVLNRAAVTGSSRRSRRCRSRRWRRSKATRWAAAASWPSASTFG